MSWRVVVISSRARLEVKLGYLVIRGTETKRVLLDEISVLLIENTGCVLSLALLDAMRERKIAVIFCDSFHNPGSQVLPFYGSHDSSDRLHMQIAWKKEAKDLVWAELVRGKIRNQAIVLKRHHCGDDWQRVLAYAEEVLPGDSTNREAHAAKVYFNALLGHRFSRNIDSFINAALNYGYSIILSVVNRAIVASGYLTQLGIFHHNVYNHFNLGSDIMEPFRPVVDEHVLSLPLEEELTHEAKMQIVSLLNKEIAIKGMRTTLLNGIGIFVRSVLEAVENCNPAMIAAYEA